MVERVGAVGDKVWQAEVGGGRVESGARLRVGESVPGWEQRELGPGQGVQGEYSKQYRVTKVKFFTPRFFKANSKTRQEINDFR